MLKWLCVWLPLAVCPLALADGPWDGVWFRDDAKSHLSGHTYSLAKLPNGMWQKDSGNQKSLSPKRARTFWTGFTRASGGTCSDRTMSSPRREDDNQQSHTAFAGRHRIAAH